MCDVVVKIGGRLLAHPGDLDRVLAAVTSLAARRRVLVVPGGGPFADAVREVDRRVGIRVDAAHWMAVLAVDQYAHFLASRLARGVVVTTAPAAEEQIDEGGIPVLAPSRWLEDVDALPHSWDVTSDSIAAWVAGEVGARDLVLIKAPAATGDLVDRHFARVRPRDVSVAIVRADEAGVRLAQLVRTADAGIEPVS